MGRWRLILDSPLEGPLNMAVDEAVLTAAANEAVCVPTLRLYAWKRPTLSIGYKQNGAVMANAGVPLVRRITGGGAVLHDIELTYSIVAGATSPLFQSGISGAYSLISACIVKALRDAGVEATFMRGHGAKHEGSEACFCTTSRYEVSVEGRKLVGSAQRRFKGVFLQHGSVIFDVNRELSAHLLGPDVVSRMAWVAAYSSIDSSAFSDLLVNRMAEGLDASFDVAGLNDAEQYLRDALIEEKYSSSAWNLNATGPSRHRMGIPTAGH